MDKIILIPAVIAVILVFRGSLEKAFLSLYLPLLLLFPDYYHCVLPGVPDPNFTQGIIFPVGIAVLVKSKYKWRWSFCDFLVIGYAVWATISEYVNNGYSEAQNLGFDMFTLAVLPYVLGKIMIEQGGLRLKFARRICFLLFVVSVIAAYQFKMEWNVFREPWRGLLGSANFHSQRRYGMWRIEGPFGDAITAAIVLTAGLLIQRWLAINNKWEPSFRYLSFWRFRKSTTITYGIAAGLIMTISRGPYMGLAFGYALLLVGRVKTLRKALLIAVPMICFLGIAGSAYVAKFDSVDRFHAATFEEETAAYRRDLMTSYVDIGTQKAQMGWGRSTWPKVPGMASIDNWYLLLFLMHGTPGLVIFLLIVVTMICRCFVGAMKPGLAPSEKSLRLTFVAIMASYLVSLATVYLGEQNFPFFFLMCGWAEGCLAYPMRQLEDKAPSTVALGRYQFARVIQ